MVMDEFDKSSIQRRKVLNIDLLTNESDNPFQKNLSDSPDKIEVSSVFQYKSIQNNQNDMNQLGGTRLREVSPQNPDSGEWGTSHLSQWIINGCDSYIEGDFESSDGVKQTNEVMRELIGKNKDFVNSLLDVGEYRKTEDEARIGYSEVVRVNHAGEAGALSIYKGQILGYKLKNRNYDLIQKMYEQEAEHYKYFDQKILEDGIRPTAMNPLWDLGGFLLGLTTALMGEKAAMTCTQAVEEVIDNHYREQIELEFIDGELKSNIKKFRDEELEHRDIAIENDSGGFVFHKLLHKFITTTTKSAIFISKKI